MRKIKKLFKIMLLTVTLFSCYAIPVFAITESDVQAQVDAVGRDSVAGNVFIWFLCAVAFLKVSQKIDSFMASLGIHVGNTGGSMLAEAMVAAKGVGSLMSLTNIRGGRNCGGSRTGSCGGGFSGGLAGIVSRQITNSAARSAVDPSNRRPGADGVGGLLYSSSVNKGGTFANNVISTIATGNIRDQGSITGEKASEALMSYLGYSALEEGAQHVPNFSNVEIGGGRITGVETSEEYPDGIAFGMYHTGQYTAPTGAYETIQTSDGNSWYKQYATDAVEKSPYKAPDGSVAYNESIVKKLPPTPRRKDQI